MASVMDSFFRTLNDNLESSVQQHLKNVYACLAMSVLSAAVGGYVHLFNIFQGGSFLSVIAAFGLLALLRGTSDDGKNRGLRLSMLLGFAFLCGLGLGPMLDIAVHLNPQLIPTAFLSTSFVFISFSLSALLTRDRKYIYLGGILFSGLSLTFFMGLCFLFFKSLLVYKLHMYLSLAIMCGFILFDTQVIVEKRRQGDHDYIWHSIDLFLDFINVFQYILKILALKEQQSKEQQEQQGRKRRSD